MTTENSKYDQQQDFYRTNSLALCPYLAVNNLTYVGTEIADSGKIVFIFKDPEHIGAEMAMSFIRSKERTYKNMWNFFRNEVDVAKKRLLNASVKQQKEK